MKRQICAENPATANVKLDSNSSLTWPMQFMTYQRVIVKAYCEALATEKVVLPSAPLRWWFDKKHFEKEPSKSVKHQTTPNHLE